mmetsp:Transcript_47367/g.139859  ORF Transcript_47367/g.139859 Transcript_47367/m.139859 type:complete len:225 (+) Transcript_47367:139-813(+)
MPGGVHEAHPLQAFRQGLAVGDELLHVGGRVAPEVGEVHDHELRPLRALVDDAVQLFKGPLVPVVYGSLGDLASVLLADHHGVGRRTARGRSRRASHVAAGEGGEDAGLALPARRGVQVPGGGGVGPVSSGLVDLQLHRLRAHLRLQLACGARRLLGPERARQPSLLGWHAPVVLVLLEETIIIGGVHRGGEGTVGRLLAPVPLVVPRLGAVEEGALRDHRSAA